MKKTLYLKFLLAYLIFGVFGFITVTIFVPPMTNNTLLKDKAETLYSEATLIANTYASGLYSSNTSLETVKLQIDALSVYMKSDIRVINPSGRVVLDTNLPLNLDYPVYIEDFNPIVISGSYYIVDNFFGTYDYDVLTVMAPSTSDYMIKRLIDEGQAQPIDLSTMENYSNIDPKYLKISESFDPGAGGPTVYYNSIFRQLFNLIPGHRF